MGVELRYTCETTENESSSSGFLGLSTCDSLVPGVPLNRRPPQHPTESPAEPYQTNVEDPKEPSIPDKAFLELRRITWSFMGSYVWS